MASLSIFECSFDNDKLSDYTNFGERQLLVYPLAQYGKLFKGKEKSEFDKIVWKLQTVIAKNPMRNENIAGLTCGRSIRSFPFTRQTFAFLTRQGNRLPILYAQDDAPINNGDFFYTYQGITDDLKYYVSLFVPVQAKGLPKDSPSKKAKEFLNNLPSSSFTPDLDQIDRMVQSISIK